MSDASESQSGAGEFRDTTAALLPGDQRFLEVEANSSFQNLLFSRRFTRTQPCHDMDEFLLDLVELLQHKVLDAVDQHRNVRVSVCVHATYSKISTATAPDAATSAPIYGYLRSKQLTVLSRQVVLSVVQQIAAAVRAKHANFLRERSGLRLEVVRAVDFFCAKYDPFARAGRQFQELPKFLKAKKAIVNVNNRDNRCFGYALLSALHPVESGHLHPTRANQYDKFFRMHPALESLKFPVSLDQLEVVERTVRIPFNVYSFFDDEGRGRYPVYLSKEDSDATIDLLFWNGHYAWIKNFSRFLGDITKNEHQRFYCKRCLGHFCTPEALANHQLFCVSIDECQQVYTMPPEGAKLRFINTRYQQRFPFIIYADFESLTVPCKLPTQSAMRKADMPIHSYQSHKPISVGMQLVSSAPGVLDTMQYETYTGDDVAEWFLRRILEYRASCFEYLFDEKRLVMTDADRRDFDDASECYICANPFKSGKQIAIVDRKVRDHDHVTGAYRGAAHSSCNLRLRTTYKIPIFLHNFRNYDGHLIVPALSVFKNSKIDVIGQSLEKYLTLTWDETLTFKDSLQFMPGSLEALVACLLESGKDKFVQLRKAFEGATDEEGIDLLLRKGVYPYDYMNDASRLDEDRLPAREHFFSTLTNRECSEKDYAHAQRVWAKFNCRTLLDYHNLYLKVDVLQLADVFESFRNSNHTHFGLDPSYYVSAPQFSWDCMMKMTDCELTLLNDPAMFEVINRNLRGGITMISKRYAKANNKYMDGLYNPNEPSSYILYLYANNLYGWAMSEPLPYDYFVWMSANECEEIAWCTQEVDQQYGYFVECDLHYPEHLHDEHNDYPLTVERIVVEEHMLSDEQRELREQYAISHTSTAKLVPNFFDKSKQLVHYRNLRFYLEHGILLTKVHRAIRFKQVRWLQPYIRTNTELRAKSKDPIEISVRKNANNSIYGKTCENLTNRTDIRLVNSRAKCQTLINKPHCLRFQMFVEELAAIELQKVKCLINKPTYVGFAVLELSKLHMFHFHYDHLRVWYPGAELLFTDTDSLVYHIHTADLYEELKHRAEQFDFSNYKRLHPLFTETNKMVLGKMKDEAAGEIITEFVGLRPKMYSYVTHKKTFDSDGVHIATSLKEAKRAKGIQRASLAAIRHAEYLAQLHHAKENYVNIRRIGQRHHRVYTLGSQKRGLCAFDDKRYLRDDGIRTYAHGHWRIRELHGAEDDDVEAVITSATTSTSRLVSIYEEDGEASGAVPSQAVVLDARQTAERGIRTHTYMDSVRALSGTNLRELLRDVVARKRSRTNVEVEDEEGEPDACLRNIDEAAQFVALNGEF
jgi:hypothetical protein